MLVASLGMPNSDITVVGTGEELASTICLPRLLKLSRLVRKVCRVASLPW